MNDGEKSEFVTTSIIVGGDGFCIIEIKFVLDTLAGEKLNVFFLTFKKIERLRADGETKALFETDETKNAGGVVNERTIVENAKGLMLDIMKTFEGVCECGIG